MTHMDRSDSSLIFYKNDPGNLWQQDVYAELLETVDPFNDLDRFRPLHRAYTGDNTFWQTPSPEPPLPDAFWQRLKDLLDNPEIQNAVQILAGRIAEWEADGSRLVFAAILRAGVPIADWLSRLFPGSVAASLSLFVGLGIDQTALHMLQTVYPDRKIIFVDGWTGKGGVSRAIASLKAGPLAVLNDPWGWADFCGSREDIFCPTACFTGAATLGFSRTFRQEDKQLFGAYRFPEACTQPHLVKQWQSLCPSRIIGGSPADGENRQFFQETALRLHSNEVCRALINADPKIIYFADDKKYVYRHYSLLLELAERRKVPVLFDRPDLKRYLTRAACELNTEKK